MFAASWWNPSIDFTLVASDLYSKLKDSNEDRFEIVYVSYDHNEDNFNSYFEKMPWTAVPFHQIKIIRAKLESKFDFSGIPTLLVVDSNGELLTIHGRSLLEKYGIDAYPFTSEHLNALAANEKEKFRVEMSSKYLPAMLGRDVSPNIHYICLALGGLNEDRAVRKLSKLLPEINAAHSDEFLALYVPWEEEENDIHKEAACGLTSIQASSLGPEARSLIQTAVGGAVELAQLLILERAADGKFDLACQDAWRFIVNQGLPGYPWTEASRAKVEEEKRLRIEALRKSARKLRHLKSPNRSTLLRSGAGEEEVKAVCKANKIVGLLFSGDRWDSDQEFLKELVKAYRELRAAGKQLEVVFVSSDENEETFKAYFSQMPWLALPFNERPLAADLELLYDISGIPALVFLKARDGEVITDRGREIVYMGAALEAWPFDPQSIAKAEEKARAEEEERVRKQLQRAVEVENAVVSAQDCVSGPKAVLRRWRGPVGSAVINLTKRTVEATAFVTVAVPGCIVPAGGRAYYELEILTCDSICQIGWATDGMFPQADEYTGEGVGDIKGSWGADGVRQVGCPTSA